MILSRLRQKALYFLFVAVAAISLNSCKDNPVSPLAAPAPGSIFITVTSSYGSLAKDVLITTEPSLKSGFTDALGTYSLKNVPEGIYEIVAMKSDYGSGKEMVSVKSGEVTKVNIQLKQGLFYSYSPIVRITSPSSQARFTPGDTVSFKAAVSDNETPVTALTVKWYSDRDGLLNSDKPNDKGEVSFQTTKLSKNTHLIRLEVTDADNNTTKDSVIINNNNPSAVKLNTLSKTLNSVLMNWTGTAESDFRSYKIYRSDSQSSEGQIIYEIFDPSVLTYEDKTITLGASYFYHIKMELKDGRYSNSNTQAITSGFYIDAATQVEKMVYDSKRNFIYAIDRVNSNLLFINVSTQKSEKTIYIGKTPTDLDIDATGDTLYVANFGSTEIAAVDLKTQAKVRSLYVKTNPYQIECGVRGQLVYAEQDQWCLIALINTDTGAQIFATGENYYYPDIEMSSNGKSIYIGESGSSGSKAYRVDIVNNQLVQVDQIPGYGYGYSSRKILLSGDGKYIVYAGIRILASNLSSQTGNYSETIYGLNSSGSLAFGETKIYNGDQFSIRRNMPVTSRVMVTSPDDTKLYIYDTKTSRIYIFDLTSI